MATAGGDETAGAIDVMALGTMAADGGTPDGGPDGSGDVAGRMLTGGAAFGGFDVASRALSPLGAANPNIVACEALSDAETTGASTSVDAIGS